MKTHLEDDTNRFQPASRPDELIEIAARHAAALDQPPLDLVLAPLGEHVPDADSAQPLQERRSGGRRSNSGIDTFRS